MQASKLPHACMHLMHQGNVPVNALTGILEDAEKAGLLKLDQSSGLYTVAPSVSLTDVKAADGVEERVDILDDQTAQDYWDRVGKVIRDIQDDVRTNKPFVCGGIDITRRALMMLKLHSKRTSYPSLASCTWH
eukprot:TRINITY_DN11926_c0_g1_i3.p1 TRINITY_DN11926_c0_g1~~TRINITY_DN11926_c0_g1_i3.p1  ORF type:complete len:133 (+),score=30.22 TRINITY_DN11926_c0_g1_i3:43-441(+)